MVNEWIHRIQMIAKDPDKVSVIYGKVSPFGGGDNTRFLEDSESPPDVQSYLQLSDGARASEDAATDEFVQLLGIVYSELTPEQVVASHPFFTERGVTEQDVIDAREYLIVESYQLWYENARGHVVQQPVETALNDFITQHGYTVITEE